MPKLPIPALIVFVSFFIISCKSKSIVGEWRSHQGVNSISPDSANLKGLFLTIRDDSTAIWDIRSGNPSSTNPGLPVAGKTNVTWKILDSNMIQFLFVRDDLRFPLVYKIAQLTEDSLILESPMEFFLKFKRID